MVAAAPNAAPRSAPAEPRELAAGYRLVAELLLNPEHRDPKRLREAGTVLDSVPARVREKLRTFLSSSAAEDVDEYTVVLELAPPCPLYLGTYLFEEPNSCRGAGLSGRNGYMIELSGVYSHYGLKLGGGELADYLPAMVDFLALSLERRDRDDIGLRRRFVEFYVLPALPKLRAELEKFDSGYQHLIEALEALVDEDIVANFDDPMWIPPAEADNPPMSAPLES